MTEPSPRPSYRGLIVPFGIAGLVFLAWSVWWIVAARQVEARLDAAAEGLRASGHTVAWTRRSVGGWPFRTLVRVEGLAVAGPQGHALRVPKLRAEANTYALGRWVVVAPQGLVITRGEGKGEVAVTGRALRASVSRPDRTPPRVAIELLEPRFTPAPGAEPFPVETARVIDLYLRPAAAGEGAGEVLLRLEQARGREGGVLHWMAGGGPFDLRAEGVLTRLDRFQGAGWGAAGRTWAAEGGGLSGLRGEAKAGDAVATLAAPRLGVDADGRLTGAMELSLTQGAAAVAALGRAPGADPGAAAAAATGADARADLTVTFAGGRTRLGPRDLAPAPKVF